MHPSTVRTGILGLRRLSLPTQQPARRAASIPVASPEDAAAPPATFTARLGSAAVTGELNGVPARVFELTAAGATIELSYPVDVRDATLRLDVDGGAFELRARVRWYRRYADGPAAYGLEFVAPPTPSGIA